ncbi:MAG: hypothetical protein JXP73_20605, partial [Deltaproteobacteria bacterium]|nr:hypothetical protein [Deltaproteobacteria bacterium]
MRSALLVTSFIASLLLNAGCGADSADLPSPDAAAVPHLDGASVSHEDAASDARPDASPVPSPDAVPVPDQDAGHIINLDARPVDAPPAIVVDAPTPGSQDAAAAETQGWTVDVAVEAGANPASIARSTLLRVTAELDETEKGELAKSLSGFAFALLQEVRRDPATQ